MFKVLKLLLLALLISSFLPLLAQTQIQNNATIKEIEYNAYPEINYTGDELYNLLQNAVVTIETDNGRCIGSIIDESGLILTSNDIIEDSVTFNIIYENNKKVKAFLVKSIPEINLAILMVNPDTYNDKIILQPARLSKEASQINEGDMLISIGSLSNKDSDIKTGKVLKISDNNITSTINIDYNNAGGPVLNQKGEIIGVNSYIEPIDKELPAEIKTIPISQAVDLIEQARNIITSESFQMPSAKELPVMTENVFPAEELENALTNKFNLRDYTNSVGPFRVIVYSPSLYYSAVKQNKLDKFKLQKGKCKNKDKKLKEYKGTNPYNIFIELDQWTKETNNFKPYIIVEIVPKTGETAGSQARGWASFILGESLGVPVYLGPKSKTFKDDLYNLELLVDGQSVNPVKRGRISNQILYADYFKNLQTNSHSGLFLFNPEILLSNDANKKEIELKLYKVSEKDKPISLKLKDKTIQSLLDDFQPYFKKLSE